MQDFIKIPATKRSLSLRRPIFGVGINDADYMVRPFVNGKQLICPFYMKWQHMLERCYSTNYHKKQPTYTECTVCDEWLTFSNFKIWMKTQDWEGNELDKDILFQGNKVYSPKTCIFIAGEINTLLSNCAASRGLYPQGVCLNKVTGKFLSYCSVKGKMKNLGYFSTPSEAHDVYKLFKYNLIKNIAEKQPEPLRSALLNYEV